MGHAHQWPQGAGALVLIYIDDDALIVGKGKGRVRGQAMRAVQALRAWLGKDVDLSGGSLRTAGTPGQSPPPSVLIPSGIEWGYTSLWGFDCSLAGCSHNTLGACAAGMGNRLLDVELPA